MAQPGPLSTNRSPPVPVAEVLRNADAFFHGGGKLHRAAEDLSRRLGELQIPFVLAGGFALGAHQYQRFTEDLDIVVHEADWSRFKETYVGRGYVERFRGSKAVHDTENDVRIDVLYVGGFPGDGKPKPVAFPDPSDASSVIGGGPFPVVTLERLLELKIASGKTAEGRRFRDFADVVELIRRNGLPPEFAERLDPYVRQEFLELHRAAAAPDALE